MKFRLSFYLYLQICANIFETEMSESKISRKTAQFSKKFCNCMSLWVFNQNY